MRAEREGGYRTPGQMIKGLLYERGWTQRVLALILDVGETTINKLVSDRQQVTAELALSLSEVFDVPAERFLELQKTYDLAKARIAAMPDPGRMTRAHLIGGLPITEMIQRGWLRADSVLDVAQVEAALTRFFGVETSDEIEILPHAAKKTQVKGEVTPPQLAWLYRVKQIASDILVPSYSEAKLRAALKKLKNLTIAAEAARHVPRILTECGIRFVIVETLGSAKIDGVCFWLSEKAPVVGMTIRYDRIDNFWFVLRHELEHVLHRHGYQAIALDAELEGKKAGVGDDLPEEERIANQAAAEFCVPKERMDSFISRKYPFFAERDLIGFARTIGVHPGLVAGQLQNRIDRYDLFRKHLVRIRNYVTPGALVDGWGDVAPVDI